MTKESRFDPQIFFSQNIAPRFGAKLDTSTYPDLLNAGLGEMFSEEVAMELAYLEDPYVMVIFPKTSPSLPLEMMITILPADKEHGPRSSLTAFSEVDASKIIHHAERVLKATKETATENGHKATDGYIFQHFNPYDLNPKTMFNGSVAHLHLHVQVYGYSLNEFPKTFTPAGHLQDYEGANRLLRDSGVSIFFDVIKQFFPDLQPEMKNNGCIGFGQTHQDSAITENEVSKITEILTVWDTIWKEFAQSVSKANPDSSFSLLPEEERISNVSKLLEKYELSEKNRKLLLFLAKSIKNQSDDVWRNFYHGPNGAIGVHVDYEHQNREWLIAPRIFRSWSRHLPLISTKGSPVSEWTTKNESGDGLLNTGARSETFGVQRRVIEKLQAIPKVR